MQPVRFEQLYFEFLRRGRDDRTQPADITPPEIATPKKLQRRKNSRSLASSSHFRRARYSLHKGLGFWRLTFEGREADVRHQTGVLYVSFLLTHPYQPIHGLDLYTMFHPILPEQGAMTEITDPATGLVTPLAANARLQQRNLSQDNRQSAKVLLHEIAAFKATLQNPTASEVEKIEAEQRLAELRRIASALSTTAKEGSQKAVKTVRRSIHRLYENLLAQKDESGQPHVTLRRFADHLHKYILIPSSSHAIPPGHLSYQPPAGIHWAR